MSSIYIQEPPTTGKVVLKSTVGDIDVELWTRETPKACRNFIQLCLEGYYNNLTFHRVVKNFIVQGGDPRGDGTGGESIYGGPFKDEFHQRLRFNRRGLVGMANSEKDDNGSQFFFTLDATPELQNKHTLFGKVTGETIFNMLKLADGLLEGDRPVYPQKILRTEVTINPFKDIVPRVVKKLEEKEKPQKKEKKKGVKNFKLLSFGDEAEADEEVLTVVNEKYAGKSKSTHDLLEDPKLSSKTIEEVVENTEPVGPTPEEIEAEKQAQLAHVKEKLAGKLKDEKKLPSKGVPAKKKETDDKYERKSDGNASDSDKSIEEYYMGQDEEKEKKRKMDEIQKEIQQLKQTYREDKRKKTEKQNDEKKKEEEKKERKFIHEEYEQTLIKYENVKKTQVKKGPSREQLTLELLEKFKNRFEKVKATKSDAKSDGEVEEEDKDVDDDSWMAHTLKFSEKKPILAKDANTKDDNWYDIDDPRHPLNKRRRNEDEKRRDDRRNDRKRHRR